MRLSMQVVRIRSLYVHAGYYPDAMKYETTDYSTHEKHEHIGVRLGSKT